MERRRSCGGKGVHREKSYRLMGYDKKGVVGRGQQAHQIIGTKQIKSSGCFEGRYGNYNSDPLVDGHPIQ